MDRLKKIELLTQVSFFHEGFNIVNSNSSLHGTTETT